MSQDKYTTRLCLVLYLFLDTPPHAVFSMQTCSGALTNTYIHTVYIYIYIYINFYMYKVAKETSQEYDI